MRTEQTANPLGLYLTLHTQTFADHAGHTATRARFSENNDPIPTDHHTHPLFTFQIYLTAPVDLEERSAKRINSSEDSANAPQTVLEKLVTWVGPSDRAQRDWPLYDIYTGLSDPLECVEHQRREIAHRKIHRSDHNIPPIAKVLHNRSLNKDRQKDGFIIVVDSDHFVNESTEAGGPLWVYFDRRSPSKISWVPPPGQNADARTDTELCRIQRTDMMSDDLAEMFFLSCGLSGTVQEKMDVAWDEDEGLLIDESSRAAQVAGTTLGAQAGSLSLHDFTVANTGTQITISNCPEAVKPDMRYVIYVPCLHQPHGAEQFVHMARLFAHEFVSRLDPQSTIHFDFYKTQSTSKIAMLSLFRGNAFPAGYIGALMKPETQHEKRDDDGEATNKKAMDETANVKESAGTKIGQKEASEKRETQDEQVIQGDIDSSNTAHERSPSHSQITHIQTPSKSDSKPTPKDRQGELQKASPGRRVHPIAARGQPNSNDPSKVKFEPYRTFFVVIETLDFDQRPGGVTFVLADGGRLKPRERPVGLVENRPDAQNYAELRVLRNQGMEQVAQRLRMG